MDVAVEIDGDEVEVVRGADGEVTGDGHEMVPLDRSAPVGRVGRDHRERAARSAFLKGA